MSNLDKKNDTLNKISALKSVNDTEPKQKKGKSERTVSFDFRKKEIKSNLYFIIRNNIFCKF
jgi:hypothetical protein